MIITVIRVITEVSLLFQYHIYFEKVDLALEIYFLILDIPEFLITFCFLKQFTKDCRETRKLLKLGLITASIVSVIKVITNIARINYESYHYNFDDLYLGP